MKQTVAQIVSESEKKFGYAFISTQKLYKTVPTLDSNVFDYVNELASKYDVQLTYPHYATDEERSAYHSLAKELSSKKTVFLYEVSIEAGGGSDLLQKADFIYQQFQPIITIASSITVGLATNYIWDLIKNLYEKRQNPIRKSQFTIRRFFQGVAYNYVFDDLTAEQAISASRLIPKEIENIDNSVVYKDVFLRYIPQQNIWIEFQP